jgi:hypothetical protein
MRSVPQIWVFMIHNKPTVTKKVVGVFVRFRAPLHWLAQQYDEPLLAARGQHPDGR